MCIYFTDAFLNAEIAEFEFGKRHLASIMGINPDTITQEEINVGFKTMNLSLIFRFLVIVSLLCMPFKAVLFNYLKLWLKCNMQDFQILKYLKSYICSVVWLKFK